MKQYIQALCTRITLPAWITDCNLSKSLPLYSHPLSLSLSLSLCLSFASLRQHARVVQTPSRLIRRPLLRVVRGANSLDIFQHRATQVHDGVFSTTPVATAELKSLMTAEEHQTCYVKARVCL